jgi:hypothetical protein
MSGGLNENTASGGLIRSASGVLSVGKAGLIESDLDSYVDVGVLTRMETSSRERNVYVYNETKVSKTKDVV